MSKLDDDDYTRRKDNMNHNICNILINLFKGNNIRYIRASWSLYSK